jgi:hypothetical protein
MLPNHDVALDRAGIRFVETPRSLPPARQVNAVVRTSRPLQVRERQDRELLKSQPIRFAVGHTYTWLALAGWLAH